MKRMIVLGMLSAIVLWFGSSCSTTSVVTQEGKTAFDMAVQSLKDGSFVLEGSFIQFRRGTMTSVSPTTNFISLEDGTATVQLVGNNMGSNSIGGITLEGRASDIQLQTDRKGNVTYRMSVMGTILTATIQIDIPYGTNRATATVYPTFNSNRLLLTGDLYPIELAKVFKGRAL